MKKINWHNLKYLSFDLKQMVQIQIYPEVKITGFFFDQAFLKITLCGEVHETIVIENVTLKIHNETLTSIREIAVIRWEDHFLLIRGFNQEGKRLEFQLGNIGEIECEFDQGGLDQLSEAVGQGNLPEIERLIDQGVDLNQPLLSDEWHYIRTDYVLIQAVKTGNFELVKFLVESRAKVNFQSNSDGETPLIVSFFIRDKEKTTQIAKYLVHQGADVNALGGFCGTPLLQAVYGDLPELVLFLIQNGADVNFCASLVDENDTRSTPLLAAIHSKNAPLTQLLLSHGASIEMEAERLPLEEAGEQGNVEVLSTLLSFAADLKQRNSWATTALFQAIRKGKLEAVDLLLKNGADLTVKDYLGETALINGVYGGAEVTKLLLDHGADPHGQNNQGETALFIAAYRSTDTLKLLLDYGANIHARDHKGETPLFKAVRAANIETSKFLLDHGVDKKVRNHEGKTALDEMLRWRPPHEPLEIRRSLEALLSP